MYYEEKIIGGVLHYRTSPSAFWQQCSIVQMGQRIISKSEAIFKLREELQNAANHLQRAMNKSHGKDADKYREAFDHANHTLADTIGE